MDKQKKSILIYFDNYPMLVSLPMEQRGQIFTALVVYGERLSHREDVTMEEIMDQFPQMTTEARLVCGFMGTNILRDTQKWFNRQQSRQQYQGKGGRGGNPAPPAAPGKSAAEDMERMRRLMEKLNAEA